MNSPMPVDELPSFVAKHNNVIEPSNNPMLKYMIVGGLLLFAFVISVAIIGKKGAHSITKNPEENESSNE
jgi:hypothetical protein